MQGASGDPAKLGFVRKLMNDPKIRVICLQECGALGDWVADTKKNTTSFNSSSSSSSVTASLTSSSSSSSSSQSSKSIQKATLENGFLLGYYEWSVSGTGNTRCSLGILIRDGVRSNLRVLESNKDTQRPVLCCDIYHPGLGQTITIYNIHAPSGGRKSTSAYIAELIEYARGKGTRWAIIGDHNQSPWTTQLNPDVNTVNTGMATQMSAGELDYGTVSSNMEGTAQSLPNGASSDHVALALELSAADMDTK
jgi:hypothetical protein